MQASSSASAGAVSTKFKRVTREQTNTLPCVRAWPCQGLAAVFVFSLVIDPFVSRGKIITPRLRYPLFAVQERLRDQHHAFPVSSQRHEGAHLLSYYGPPRSPLLLPPGFYVASVVIPPTNLICQQDMSPCVLCSVGDADGFCAAQVSAFGSTKEAVAEARAMIECVSLFIFISVPTAIPAADDG